MEKNLKEKLIKIEKEMKELPTKAQCAVYWIIENFDFVIEICKESDMTDEEIEKYRENAKEKEDYIALALLCVTKACKNMGYEVIDQ